MDNVIICAVEVMDAADTADISDDLKDAADDKEDKESLFIFENLENVPDSGKSEEDHCENARS